MILTRKAKDDFLKWLQDNYELLIEDVGGFSYFWNAQTRVSEYALIIEWFDSVGITVDVMPILDNPIKWVPNTFWIAKEISTDDSEYYETRQQATTEAIKKANEIYNNK